MSTYRVRIHELSRREDAVDLTTNVRAEDRKEAVEKATKKLFGKNCFWFPDSGLGFFYGQVFKPVSQKLGGGNSSQTCRARAYVEAVGFESVWYSPRNFNNEGYYIYGSAGEIHAFFKEKVAGDADSGWGMHRDHRTLEGARNRAEKSARSDNAGHIRCGEIACISAVHVSEIWEGK